jgi:hypothetical protein
MLAELRRWLGRQYRRAMYRRAKWLPWLMSIVILIFFGLSFVIVEPNRKARQDCNALKQTLLTTHDQFDLRRADMAVRDLNCSTNRLDVVQKLGASFAFAIGGFWVLMNYLANRTHFPRLQVEVSAELVESDAGHYLLAKCAAKNVGFSIVPLERSGTALAVTRAFRHVPEEKDTEAHWDALSVAGYFEIFSKTDEAGRILEEHKTVEPALAIYEEKLIYLGVQAYDAYRARLTVSAQGQQWFAVAVAVRKSDSERGDPGAT